MLLLWIGILWTLFDFATDYGMYANDIKGKPVGQTRVGSISLEQLNLIFLCFNGGVNFLVLLVKVKILWWRTMKVKEAKKRGTSPELTESTITIFKEKKAAFTQRATILLFMTEQVPEGIIGVYVAMNSKGVNKNWWRLGQEGGISLFVGLSILGSIAGAILFITIAKQEAIKARYVRVCKKARHSERSSAARRRVCSVVAVCVCV